MEIITKLINNNDTYNNVCNGTLEDNLLKYNENGIDVIFDLENNKLYRESDGFKMEYEFIEGIETVNSIFIKDIEKYIDIRIITNILNKSHGFIDIEYQLIDDGSIIRYTVNYGG